MKPTQQCRLAQQLRQRWQHWIAAQRLLQHPRGVVGRLDELTSKQLYLSSSLANALTLMSTLQRLKAIVPRGHLQGMAEALVRQWQVQRVV